MSVVSNVHTSEVYNAKTSKPFDGQRLVVTIAKKDAQGNYGPNLQQTQCTSIPVLQNSEIDFTQLSVQNACVDYFQSVQNQIINARIKDGQKSVRTEDITTDKIIDFLNAESTGNAWTTERIASWFDETIAEFIAEKLMEKGFDDSKLEQSLNAYKKLISETFSSKSVIPRMKAQAIDKAFKLVDSPDSTLTRFQARIDKVLTEVSMDELLGL
jgi:hypothetical protein